MEGNKTKRSIRVWLMRVGVVIATFVGGFILWKIWIWFYPPDDIAEALRMFSVGFCYWTGVIMMLLLLTWWFRRKRLWSAASERLYAVISQFSSLD